MKRGSAGDELTEELLLAQPVSEENPEGKTLLHLVPEDRGALSGIIPDLGCKNPTLTVYYFKDLGGKEVYYSRDVYDLPLDGSRCAQSGRRDPDSYCRRHTCGRIFRLFRHDFASGRNLYSHIRSREPQDMCEVMAGKSDVSL